MARLPFEVSRNLALVMGSPKKIWHKRRRQMGSHNLYVVFCCLISLLVCSWDILNYTSYDHIDQDQKPHCTPRAKDVMTVSFARLTMCSNLKGPFDHSPNRRTPFSPLEYPDFFFMSKGHASHTISGCKDIQRGCQIRDNPRKRSC